MARAHEKLRSLNPANGASQVPAVDAEGDEFILADAPEPGCGFGSDPGPGKRRWVSEVNLDGLPDAEGIDFSNAAPQRSRGSHDRSDEKADNGYSHQSCYRGRASNAYARKESAPADFGRFAGRAIDGDV